MKKSILILITAVGLFAYQAFGQNAIISISGVNSTIQAASGSTVTLQLTLTISGNNSIGDVESVNMLLKTFAGGGGLHVFVVDHVLGPDHADFAVHPGE